MRSGVMSILFCLLPGLAAGSESHELPHEMGISSARTLMHLREEISAAEDQVHALWNDLVDEERFRIHCVWESRTGSWIKRKRCAPQFIADLTMENASDFFNQVFAHTNGPTITPDATGARRAQLLAVFQEKMKTMAAENPDFREAIVEHSLLADRLKAAQKTVFQKD